MSSSSRTACFASCSLTCFLSVLDPAVDDFKGSARRYLDRADAILMPACDGEAASPWMNDLQAILSRARVFRFTAPLYVTPELVRFVASHLPAAETHQALLV